MRKQMILPIVLARTLSIHCEGYERVVYQVSELPMMTPAIRYKR
ncbi:MAG: hypothetical protein ACRDHZ_10175 [Ktedonobacteraceae bacterium]